MKFLYLEKKMKYDGSALASRWIYLNHGISGDTVLAFCGPCDVDFKFMADGQDLTNQSSIRSDEMLHFLFEIFDLNHYGGVALQRLFSAIIKDYMEEKTGKKFRRQGDDIFFEDQKLSISVAKSAVASCLIHLALNLTQEGTPVKTCALEDFSLFSKKVATDLGGLFQAEWKDLKSATHKVLL